MVKCLPGLKETLDPSPGPYTLGAWEGRQGDHKFKDILTGIIDVEAGLDYTRL